MFSNLSASRDSVSDFSSENYMCFKYIGYILLVSWVYRVICGFIFSLFLLKDVVILGEGISFYPDLSELSKLILVLMVFVFAEVYRSAVVIKEESELTI